MGCSSSKTPAQTPQSEPKVKAVEATSDEKPCPETATQPLPTTEAHYWPKGMPVAWRQVRTPLRPTEAHYWPKGMPIAWRQVRTAAISAQATSAGAAQMAGAEADEAGRFDSHDAEPAALKAEQQREAGFFACCLSPAAGGDEVRTPNA